MCSSRPIREFKQEISFSTARHVQTQGPDIQAESAGAASRKAATESGPAGGGGLASAASPSWVQDGPFSCLDFYPCENRLEASVLLLLAVWRRQREREGGTSWSWQAVEHHSD